MDHTSTFEKILRGVLITLVLVFFLFPILWIFLMSLQTNETILRIPPSLAFTPIIDNYTALITGESFEDISPDIEHAYRIAGNSWWKTFTRISIPLAKPGIAAAGLLAFIFAWNNFIFALILASADKQPVTVGALAFVTASGIQYGQIAAAIIISITPTLALALYAQRYLVEGLSMGAVKG